MIKKTTLTEQQLIDFSIVIAEFMGFWFETQTQPNGVIMNRSIHYAKCFYGVGGIVEWIWHHDNITAEQTLDECKKSVSKKLNYFGNWNALMPVLERIEDETAGIEIFQEKCTILYDVECTNNSIYNWCDTKILACFASAYEYCEFLKTKTDG